MRRRVLDFADTSIVNVALPSIPTTWTSQSRTCSGPSGYVLTYGGFLLLADARDLLGRRRILVAGTAAVRALVDGLRPGPKLGDAGRRAASPVWAQP